MDDNRVVSALPESECGSLTSWIDRKEGDGETHSYYRSKKLKLKRIKEGKRRKEESYSSTRLHLADNNLTKFFSTRSLDT